MTERFTSERVTRWIASRFNPISGLTPATLLRQLECWRRGDMRDLALLWEEMEQRDWVLKNVVSKRKRDAARCDWEIITEDDSAEAEAQKEFLEDFYSRLITSHVIDQDQRGGVPLLLRQMMDAVGKRYAIHEIVWKPSRNGSLTAELHACPVWFFESRTGRLRFLPSDWSYDGEAMDEDEWLVTVGDGLMLASSVAYVAKDLGFKDWLNVSEKFGIPGIDAETDAAPGSPEWNALLEAVQAFGRDWAIVRNRNAKINLVELKGGSALPQPPLIEYLDRALASLWRGADLSTISANSGAGQGASLQGDEAETIREDDCALLSETIQQRLDLPALRWRWGKDVVAMAYFQVTPPKRQNVTQDLEVDRFLVENGAPVAVPDVLQRYGRPKPDDDEALLEAPVPQPQFPGLPGQRQASPGDEKESPPDTAPEMANEEIAAQRQAIREAFAADLQPLRDRVRRILAIDDESIFRAKLAEFHAELPDLLRSINADPSAAREIEVLMAEKLLGGLTSAASGIRPGAVSAETQR